MKIFKYFILILIFLLGCSAMVFYEGDIPADVVDARYTSSDSQFLRLGDLGRLHYRDEGRRQAPPLLLIHGSNASLHIFEPWVVRLKDKFRIITIDLPGHGLTGEVPSGDYSSKTMVEVVNALVNKLELEHFVIGGSAMGGSVALRYVLDHPEKITGLVLIDAAGYTKNGGETDTSQGILAFSLIKHRWFRAIGEVMDPYYFVSQGLKGAFHDQAFVTEAMVMRYHDLTLRKGTRKATMKRFSQTTDENFQDGDLANFAELDLPTLLMWGKEDAIAPFTLTAGYEALVPNISTAYYADVGHLPMEEVPKTSAADLIDFMEAIDEN